MGVLFLKTNHSLFSPTVRVEGWEKRAGVMRALLFGAGMLK
jgi:hypothetical protein